MCTSPKELPRSLICSRLHREERGAGSSTEMVLVLAVAVLILMALLQMMLSPGGILSRTQENLIALINGENITGGGGIGGGGDSGDDDIPWLPGDPGDGSGVGPGTDPGDGSGVGPGTDPGDGSGGGPGSDPGDGSGVDPGTDPGDGSGDDPDDDPGDGTDVDPGDDPDDGSADGDALSQEKLDLALDIAQLGLDIAGIADPTPISDGLNTLISIGRGRWWDAAFSAIGIIPYIGDLAKLGKLPKWADSIASAVKIAKNDAKFAEQIAPALKKIRNALEQIPPGRLPQWAKKHVDDIKRSTDDLVKSVPKLLPFKPKWTGRIINYKKGAMTPIEHIMYRHGPKSGFSNAGRFADGTTARTIRELVDEAASKGTATFRPDGSGGIVYDFGKNIGYHMDGSIATKIQVYFNDAGEVMTAYPFN